MKVDENEDFKDRIDRDACFGRKKYLFYKEIKKVSEKKNIQNLTT